MSLYEFISHFALVAIPGFTLLAWDRLTDPSI